jgi:hypothetical protein
MRYFRLIFIIIAFYSTSAEAHNISGGSDTLYTQALVETMPQYPGGLSAFYAYVNDAYKTPKAALNAMVSGDMLVSFVIEKDGALTDIKILKDLKHGTGKELIRVLQKCPRWQPGMQNGRPVRVQYSLPVMLPPPPISLNVQARRIPETSVLPVTKVSESAKLPLLTAVREKFIFPERFETCMPDTFVVEDIREAISDRYSILEQIAATVPPDSLKKLTGRISFQVLVDGTGTPCLLSLKNELNMPHSTFNFPNAIKKTKWSLYAGKQATKTPVAAILVFTFTEARIKYQHLAFNSNSSGFKELEQTEKGKFTHY